MRKLKRYALKRKNMFIRVATLAFPLVFALLLLSQTAFAQTTYVITDGSRVLIHTTSATDPGTVLDEAGLELGADDTYTTHASDGVSEITIQRSQTVTIDYFGERKVAASLGETVGALLERLELTFTADDTVSHPLEAQTCDGMLITVANVVRQEQTFTSLIPHETVYCTDSTLPEGTEKVLTPGVSGEMLCHAAVTYTNGVESQKTVLSQQVLSQPVTEVIARGCGSEIPEPPAEDGAMPVISDSTITLPTGEVLTYTKTSQVRATAYTHTDPGCDFYTATGTRVHHGTVAVDPRYIPYGTRMFIVANDGSYIYGISTAEDCGGAIKGDRIDLYFPTYSECIQFGWRDCTIYFLG